MANAVPISGEWTDAPEIPTEQPQPVAPPAQRKLNLVLPFIESDIQNVIRLLKWCAELSGKVPYTLFLLPFKGLNFTEVKMYAERAFSDVQIIQDGEGVVSDWKTDSKIRDAAGPNSMFRQAAWFFYFHQALGSWLYLEPDCVPLKKDWIEQLEKDHFASGSPISGQKMSVGDKPYLNGVAIYPPNVINEAPEIVTQTMWNEHPEMEIAFDIAGGNHVLQKAHLTDKIQLSYRTDSSPLSLNAVLYHGDRNGRIIAVLENELRIVRLSPKPAREELKKGGDATCPSMTYSEEQRQNQKMGSNGAADVQPVASAETLLQTYVDRLEAKHPHLPNLSIGDQIRFHVNALAELENGQPSRRQRIVDELRKRKLIPRARTQWKLPRR